MLAHRQHSETPCSDGLQHNDVKPDGIDFAFWEDRTGEINNYFTGIILILLLQCNVTILNKVFLKEVTMGSMFVIVTMRQKDVLKKKPDTTPAIVTRIFP